MRFITLTADPGRVDFANITLWDEQDITEWKAYKEGEGWTVEEGHGIRELAQHFYRVSDLRLDGKITRETHACYVLWVERFLTAHKVEWTDLVAAGAA